MERKLISWFSCGSTSAVATKLALDKFGKDNVDIWYIETGAHHEDNKRFLSDCEKWYEKKINIAQSPYFKSPLEVAKKYLFTTPYGAPCTMHLKKLVRRDIIMPLYKDFEVYHILGFEYNKHEINRALRWQQQQTPNCYFPLIDNRLDKQKCLQIIKAQGIEVPAMYKLGYHNNNCIGCFKAGAGYWNKIKKDFPERFEEISKVEQETHHTILKKDGKPLYLKDLPENMENHKDLEIEDCGLFCDLEMNGVKIYDLEEARTMILKESEE